MSHQDLINALLQDGRHQCEQIIEKAKADAEEIVKNAERELERQKKEYLNKIETDIKIKSVEVINRAKINANGRILKAKYEAIENIFKKATERFLEIRNEKRYLSIFEKLCKEVLGDIKGETKVIMDSEDASLFKKLFPDINAEIAPVNSSKVLGIELITKNGSVIIKNTLISRLEKIKPELMLELNKLLFGKV
ncbi:MAG: V-type ATP synthase subunit E [Nitrospirota bacterium]